MRFVSFRSANVDLDNSLMLKYRLLTALILIPVTLLFLFYAPPLLLGLLLFALILLCGLEWVVLIPIQRPHYFFLFGLAALSITAFYAPFFFLVIGSMLWCMMVSAIFTFPRTQSYWGNTSFVTGLGLIFLPLSFTTLTQLYTLEHGSELFLYLLLLVWATDTGAYFTGKLAGKHRLIPEVSPNKTLEGLLGGIGLACFVGLLGYVYFKPNSGIIWTTQLFLTVFMAIIGDLLISMLKRRVKCKDTGHLLPGHGGLLDRLDSLIAAAPFFYMMT